MEMERNGLAMANRGRVPEKVERQREISARNLPGPHPQKGGYPLPPSYIFKTL